MQLLKETADWRAEQTETKRQKREGMHEGKKTRTPMQEQQDEKENDSNVSC